MINIGIIGATGYTGVELVRLALGHPEIKIKVITSEKSQGIKFSEAFPSFQGIFDLTLEPFKAKEIAATYRKSIKKDRINPAL